MSGLTIIDILFDILEKKKNFIKRLKSNPDKVYENLDEYYKDLGLDICKFSTLKIWIEGNFDEILSYSFIDIDKIQILFKKYFYKEKLIEQILNLKCISEEKNMEKSIVLEKILLFTNIFVIKLEEFYQINIGKI